MRLGEVAFASRRHGNGGASDWRRQLEGNGSKNGISFSSMCFIDLPLQKITAAARVCDCGRECRTVIWKCCGNACAACWCLEPLSLCLSLSVCVCVWCWFYSRDHSVLLLINPPLTTSKDSNTEAECRNRFPGYSWSECTSDGNMMQVLDEYVKRRWVVRTQLK